MEVLWRNAPCRALIGILGGMVVDEAVRARPRNRLVTALLVIAVVPLALVAVLRLVGYDGGWYLLIALALTPFVAVAGVLLGILALVLRRWWIGATALALSLALVVLAVPRMSEAEQRDVHGGTLRVMAANLYYGRADPQAIVNLVRERRVDVLNLVELTPKVIDGLTAAGLFTLLPNRVLHPEPGAYGSGIVSRFPLKEVELTGDSAAKQPGAQADLGNGVVVEIVAVHPQSPDAGADQWVREMKDLSDSDRDHGLRILAGDFNATLDHAAFRTVLARGYQDAGDARGEALTPTWPATYFPVVTLDHVLVDSRAAVRDYGVLDVPGSDHRAVFAEVQLP